MKMTFPDTAISERLAGLASKALSAFAPGRATRHERAGKNTVFLSTGTAGNFASAETGDAAIASALYEGDWHGIDGGPDGRGFDNLDWLRHLSASGKILHTILAARLLANWQDKKRRAANLGEELLRLRRLSEHAPAMASRIDADLAVPFMTAFRHQVRRVFALRDKNIADTIDRAMVLIPAAAMVDGHADILDKAKASLDRGLARMVLPDGGPANGDINWLLRLFNDLSMLRQFAGSGTGLLNAESLAALDRMGPFVAMLQRADGSRFGEHGAAGTSTAHALMQPLGLAPHAGFARLAHKTSTLVCRYAGAEPLFEFATSAGPLMNFGICNNSGATVGPSTLVSGNPVLRSTSKGSLLDFARPDFARRLFLAADGLDLRVEDSTDGCACAAVQLRPGAGVTVTAGRNASELKLLTPDFSVWQLSTRAAHFTRKTGTSAILLTSGAADKSTVNWALRRLSGPDYSRMHG